MFQKRGMNLTVAYYSNIGDTVKPVFFLESNKRHHVWTVRSFLLTTITISGQNQTFTSHFLIIVKIHG